MASMAYPPRGFDSLAQAEEDNNPGHCQTNEELPAEDTQVLNPLRDL